MAAPEIPNTAEGTACLAAKRGGMPLGRRAMDFGDGTAAALREALDDEYHARATYRRVIETFGEVRPFANVVEAEERHIGALLALFERYGLDAPPDRWRGCVPAPSSIRDACGAAIEAEIQNVAMYDRLLAMVDDPHARAIMQRLQEASRERHLPAFRRCLASEAEGRGRRGRGEHANGRRATRGRGACAPR